MFDVGFSEIALIAVVALIAVGPEDLPDMLFKFGRFMRQAKMYLGNFRNQYADLMHEAEVAHYRKQLGLPIDPEAKIEAPVIDHAPSETPPETTPENTL